MNNISIQINNYMEYCRTHKRLADNTMRAYRIDMKQFTDFLRKKQLDDLEVKNVSKELLKEFVEQLQKRYAVKTCKRKIACIKAFFNHLEMEDIIPVNPFRKLRIKMREGQRLPKTIKKQDIDLQLKYIYHHAAIAKTPYQEYHTARAIACYELLINTGIRIGEACNLKENAIDFDARCIRILGKGNKERIAYLTADAVVQAIQRYMDIKNKYHYSSPYLFVNWQGRQMKEETARSLIRRVSSATIGKHITPHMFRHTFASPLLNLNVDIRYIQELLGHSSINTTQIYLHLLNTSIRTCLERANLRQQYSCA